ncbi:MAG TPA: ion transporter [Verrucomicrobiota bacterium]|nr:ion transporter [Verrucomicrobiota bacterium]
MKENCRHIVDSKAFQRFIILVILAAAVLIGLETSPALMARHGDLLHLLDKIILAIFSVEIVVKMAAQGSQPWRYFRDGWNVFDFIIVAVCFLPMDGQYAAVLRLVRILRVLRLISGVPRLQLLVGALLKSIPSMGYVGLLLLILFYIYGVIGRFLFGAVDPVHFGSLGDSMLSLFRVITLEDWTDLMYTQMFGAGYVEGQTAQIDPTPHAIVSIVYFVTFILFGTMIMLNLFIGVIMNSMNEVQIEAEIAQRAKHREELGHVTVADELAKLERQIGDLKTALHTAIVRLKTENKESPASTTGRAHQI